MIKIDRRIVAFVLHAACVWAPCLVILGYMTSPTLFVVAGGIAIPLLIVGYFTSSRANYDILSVLPAPQDVETPSDSESKPRYVYQQVPSDTRDWETYWPLLLHIFIAECLLVNMWFASVSGQSVVGAIGNTGMAFFFLFPVIAAAYILYPTMLGAGLLVITFILEIIAIKRNHRPPLALACKFAVIGWSCGYLFSWNAAGAPAPVPMPSPQTEEYSVVPLSARGNGFLRVEGESGVQEGGQFAFWTGLSSSNGQVLAFLSENASAEWTINLAQATRKMVVATALGGKPSGECGNWEAFADGKSIGMSDQFCGHPTDTSQRDVEIFRDGNPVSMTPGRRTIEITFRRTSGPAHQGVGLDFIELETEGE